LIFGPNKYAKLLATQIQSSDPTNIYYQPKWKTTSWFLSNLHFPPKSLASYMGKAKIAYWRKLIFYSQLCFYKICSPCHISQKILHITSTS
jgi:hypothetical protein